MKFMKFVTNFKVENFMMHLYRPFHHVHRFTSSRLVYGLTKMCDLTSLDLNVSMPRQTGIM